VTMTITIPFKEVDIGDIAAVGGKNASLGEMIQNLSQNDIAVPAGFAITAEAYWLFISENQLRKRLESILGELDIINFSNLHKISEGLKSMIMAGHLPKIVQCAIEEAYNKLGAQISVAVRSSATAEDLPHASFAGQQETYLNISGIQQLMEACKKCYASLFTARAIKYRIDHGFQHMDVALSVGVQKMVRSDLGCSGVMFTLDPDTGFKDVIVVNGVWGLGENIVQGKVDPDEFVVFKPSLKNRKKSIISKRIGKKQQTMIYADKDNTPLLETTRNIDTPAPLQDMFVLTDAEVEQLANWALLIEQHYKMSMDIEWAKDGINKQLYIVQARPETIHSIKANPHILSDYQLKERSKVITTGISLGNKIASGKARILNNPYEADKLNQGDVLVADITNPDWDPVMKKVAAIVTNKGGRTSHAAIVARELGVVAIVGTGNATKIIEDGQDITVCCAEGATGIVYDGLLQWERQVIDTQGLRLPKTKVMLIMADPEKAMQNSLLPNNGVGLMRMEFVINNIIKVHPMALVKFNELEDEKTRKAIQNLTRHFPIKKDYFVDRLSQAVATVAAAFFPKAVVVRMSDFKSNEYANLLGGEPFEPSEENPMLGLRGASRYYSPLYRAGFQLECEAMKIVRNDMGLTNVKLMIPFCRTIEEGKKIIDLMATYGLKQGENQLDIYTMIEVPSNVLLAQGFAEIFDGFSVGSNDLTQLALGLDRDSELVSELFDENNEAVRLLIAHVISTAREKGIDVGLCGQAPSDSPHFARFLVEHGINSISFTADSLLQGIKNIHQAERSLKQLINATLFKSH